MYTSDQRFLGYSPSNSSKVSFRSSRKEPRFRKGPAALKPPPRSSPTPGERAPLQKYSFRSIRTVSRIGFRAGTRERGAVRGRPRPSPALVGRRGQRHVARRLGDARLDGGPRVRVVRAPLVAVGRSEAPERRRDGVVALCRVLRGVLEGHEDRRRVPRAPLRRGRPEARRRVAQQRRVGEEGDRRPDAVGPPERVRLRVRHQRRGDRRLPQEARQDPRARAAPLARVDGRDAQALPDRRDERAPGRLGVGGTGRLGEREPALARGQVQLHERARRLARDARRERPPQVAVPGDLEAAREARDRPLARAGRAAAAALDVEADRPRGRLGRLERLDVLHHRPEAAVQRRPVVAEPQPLARGVAPRERVEDFASAPRPPRADALEPPLRGDEGVRPRVARLGRMRRQLQARAGPELEAERVISVGRRQRPRLDDVRVAADDVRRHDRRVALRGVHPEPRANKHTVALPPGRLLLARRLPHEQRTRAPRGRRRRVRPRRREVRALGEAARRAVPEPLGGVLDEDLAGPPVPERERAIQRLGLIRATQGLPRLAPRQPPRLRRDVQSYRRTAARHGFSSLASPTRRRTCFFLR